MKPATKDSPTAIQEKPAESKEVLKARAVRRNRQMLQFALGTLRDTSINLREVHVIEATGDREDYVLAQSVKAQIESIIEKIHSHIGKE